MAKFANSPLFAALLAALVVVAIALLMSRRQGRPTNASEKARLLNACLGDGRMVRRLVALEKQKNPRLSSSEATSNALASIHRDNS